MVVLPGEQHQVAHGGNWREPDGGNGRQGRRGGEGARALRGATEEVRSAEGRAAGKGQAIRRSGGRRRASGAALRRGRRAARNRAGAELAVLHLAEENVSGDGSTGGGGGPGDRDQRRDDLVAEVADAGEDPGD